MIHNIKHMEDDKSYYIAINPFYEGKYCMLGILQELHNNRLLQSSEGYICSGTGIFLSIFLMLGYKPCEIIAPINIMEKSDLPILKLSNFIKKRFGNIPCLSDLTKISAQTLSIVTYTSSGQELISENTHPYMDIITLMCISMLKEYKYQDEVYYNSGSNCPISSTILDDGSTKIISICDNQYPSIELRTLSELLISLSTNNVKYIFSREFTTIKQDKETNINKLAIDYKLGINTASIITSIFRMSKKEKSTNDFIERKLIKFTVPSDLQKLIRINCDFS